MNFFDWGWIFNNPSTFLTFILALGVIFVNGFTDAPNAIATTVSTGTLSMNRACILCAICNFLGISITTLLNMSVARRVFDSADFGKNTNLALCAVFFSIILFSVCAWMLAMPSSESHALIGGLAGASMALSKSFDFSPFIRIMIYMIISCGASFIISIIFEKLFKKIILPYEKLQVASCAATSFMHGAQDGQKFIGVLMFLELSNNLSGSDRSIVPLVIVVSATMCAGTLLGGGKIVKSIGDDIVKLNTKTAFISDASATLCLIFCSALGFPVSTSNIKACSVAGTGFLDKKSINVKTLLKMLIVAALTFPCCMIISYTVSIIFA